MEVAVLSFSVMKLSPTILALIIVSILLGCKDARVFKKLPAKKTGIFFNNHLEEDDQHNVYEFMNFYTGAGVAAGDINNDGLTDLYFSGNLETGRLFLNKGNLQFEDITLSSGLENNQWGAGCTMVDINQDGWLDIYVAVSGAAKPEQRRNLLFVNNGDYTFTEQAESYGIADSRQTQHAAFLDYDRDGDLDLFLIINPAAYEQRVNIVAPRKVNGEALSTDVLYRNNGNGSFTDVSAEAGILIEGYSLGVGISDINNDGWADIYISNDFVGNDVLYINNGDGSFTDKAAAYLQHTSYAGMGNDVADFNNDGLVDILVLDMRPEDNFRQKLIISSTSYDLYQLMLKTGYMPQYSRNTLQLNRGNGHFSEVGFMSGISSTDWSWSSLFADYDNDGDKDLFITNGFLRDLGNLDYIHYQNVYDNPMGEKETKIKNKLDAIKSLEGADIRDYLFENTGGLSFQKRSKEWGINDTGFSNGAVYVDLDNDGDLELVVNNINGYAHVYENLTDSRNDNNFLQLKLSGPSGNLQGIGAKITLYQNGSIQVYEHFLSRGYESSVDPMPHFGLGLDNIDSLIITWPDGKAQQLPNVKPNQLLELSYINASDNYSLTSEAPDALFQEFHGLNFIHIENEQVDFKAQPILPHMHAQLGPGMSVSDINGDHLDDIYVGAASGQPGSFLLQSPDSSGFITQKWNVDSTYEDMGSLFFDVDSDGDLDLFVVSGGTTHPDGSPLYEDRLYLNQGNGHFSRYNDITLSTGSGSCVVGADYDKDGDIDLFIGGRVIPGAYPHAPRSYLFRNDTDPSGNPKFKDVTNQIEGLREVGMVTAALWTDFDNDHWTDLLIVGEFMPITVVKNKEGSLELIKAKGLEDSEGWWNSIIGGDFDNDGDIDYVAGNLGLNSRYVASKKEPLCIYANDYDKNGRLDPVLCYYVDGENYLAHTRDDIIKQINAMRVRFKTYEEYAETPFDRSFLPSELEEAYVVHANRFESTYIENVGGGTFMLHALPAEAQMAPVFGILTDDYDGNGTSDLLLTGNSFSTEVSTGRYDASFGLLLSGDGKGGWHPLSIVESGIANKGDAKGMVSLNYRNNNIVAIANNNSRMNAFTTKSPTTAYKVLPNDQYATLYYPDGINKKIEFYVGSGYISQSARSFHVDDLVVKITITDSQGKTRDFEPIK